jgi:hypothetical protein
MTDWSYETCDPVYQDRSSRTRKVFVRTIPALAAFSFSAAVALRLAGGLAGDAGVPSDVGLHAAAQSAAGSQSTTSAQTPESGALAKSAAIAVAHVALESGPAKPSMDKPRNPFGGLFDPDLASTGMAGMTAQNDPVGPSFSPLQSEPLFALVETPDSATQIAEADTNQQVAEAEAAQGDAAQTADATQANAAIAQALANVPLPPLRTGQVAEAEPPAAIADSRPLPPARPAELSSIARVAVDATPRREVAAPATPLPAPPTRAAAAASVRERAQATTFARNDPRSLFDKLFSGNSEQKGPQLAYASQESGGGGLFNLSRGPSASPPPFAATGGTAVYDISAHTVYLPNGQALEAHSGLGPYFDHPGYVHVRMRGATPPATYQLTLRESLFHGVQALRLTPLDSNVHGRNGLLAHTFMLGQRGDSNGCVSFRNYRAFLEAYMRGEIRQLKVVASR